MKCPVPKQMWEDPIETNDHSIKKEFRYREEDQSKNLGGAIMIIKGFKSEEERINDSRTRYPILHEGNVNSRPHEFRPRFPDKEIQPDMHFANKSPYMQVRRHFLPKLGSTMSKEEEESTNEKGMAGTAQTWGKSTFKSKSNGKLATVYNPSFTTAQPFFSPFHTETKLHFKGVESFSLQLPDSVARVEKKYEKERKKEEEKRKEEDNGEFVKPSKLLSTIYQNSLAGQSPADELMSPGLQSTHNDNSTDQIQITANKASELDDNPYARSKIILEKCKVSKPKKPVSLYCGSGHYLSDPRITIHESYERFLPK